MPGKFSLDLPKLKIASSKPEKKSARHPLPDDLDSPPQTPKSVRPPLPADLEADLRLACAHVLHGPTPPKSAAGDRALPQTQRTAAHPQLDYAAIKAAAGRLPDPAGMPALIKAKTSLVEPRARPQHPELLDLTSFGYTSELFLNAWAAPDESDRERERLLAHEWASSRADQLMAAPAQQLTSQDRPSVHLRSRSTPHPHLPFAPSVLDADLDELPTSLVPRTASIDTARSTPHTDATEDPWNASTAMTSAAPTPARSSKRTSAQAAHTISESDSVPKVQPVDADWMRRELEKHKKMQERHTAAASAAVTAIVAAKPQTALAMPPARMPARKPIASCTKPNHVHIPAASDFQAAQLSAYRPEQHAERPDAVEARPRLLSSGFSASDSSDTESQTAKETRRYPADVSCEADPAESKQGREEECRGRQSFRSRAASGARSLSRGVQDYFYPALQSPEQSAQGRRRSSSRNRSITSHLKDYFRPGTATSTSEQSADLFMASSRTSKVRPAFERTTSQESSNSKGQRWQAFHYPMNSSGGSDIARPGSSGSGLSTRGRPVKRPNFAGDSQHSAMSSLNLNRNLPPLPGPTQWKGNESADEDQAHKRAVASHDMADPDELVAAPFDSPVSSVSAEDLNVFPEVLHERLPPAQTAHVKTPLSHRPMLSATLSPGDFDIHSHVYTPSPISKTSMAAPSPLENISDSRSRSVDSASSPELSDQSDELPKTAVLVSEPTLKAQVVHYSRVPAVRFLSDVTANRSGSGVGTPSVVKMGTAPSPGHNAQRPATATARSAQITMDDYARMYNPQYHNIVEINPSAKPPVPSKDKARKKWWKPNAKERDPDWMDAVVRSGSRGGMLLVDETAAAPIVRY